MKKIFCFLIVLALTTGVHAEDKKKKKPAAKPSPQAQTPGGGGTSAPSMPRGFGQLGNRNSGSQGNTHAGMSATNPMTRSGSSSHAPNSVSRSAGQPGGSAPGSNPLLRKGGQANSTSHGSNPLLRNNRQAGPNNSNPLAKKNAASSSINGRNSNLLTRRNNPNLNGKHTIAAQAGRRFDNRVGTRNWQHASHANYRVRNYRDVFHNYHAVRHDRGWYRTHYDRVVVMGGGYYYWDAGYWYPAWGYDPGFSFYVYDGPIYSYDNLPPDQVTVNVQTELQDEGYYTGDIDGQVGPKTRDALGAYQTDHNLEVTSAIDEPTVEALGLTASS